MDHNIEFGHTKGFLQFLLKLLGYSAAPSQADYKVEQEEKSSSSHGPSYALGALPSHLQAPWLRVFFVILYKVREVVYHVCSYSETNDPLSGLETLYREESL